MAKASDKRYVSVVQTATKGTRNYLVIVVYVGAARLVAFAALMGRA